MKTRFTIKDYDATGYIKGRRIVTRDGEEVAAVIIDRDENEVIVVHTQGRYRTDSKGCYLDVEHPDKMDLFIELPETEESPVDTIPERAKRYSPSFKHYQEVYADGALEQREIDTRVATDCIYATLQNGDITAQTSRERIERMIKTALIYAK